MLDYRAGRWIIGGFGLQPGCRFLAEAALELAPSPGRILLVAPFIGTSHSGHGIALPSCIRGGPGRAGGCEELGALVPDQGEG